MRKRNEQTNNNEIISNVFWRFADKWGSQTVSFVISVVLARILEPSDFGVVVTTNALINIFGVFCDCGLGSSLIQRKNVDDLDYSTALVTNVLLCSIVYLVIFITSPKLALLYNNNSLVSLIRVSSLTILISSYKNIQHSYVAKNLLFKKYFFSSMAGTILSGIIGILLAINGFGAWSLVFSSLIDTIIDTIVSYFIVGWKIKLSFSFERLKRLLGFGIKIFIIGLLNKIHDKLYSLVIGYRYTDADLAYFNKGDTLSNKIYESISYSVNSVMFPVLSKHQNDVKIIKDISKKSLKMNFFVLCPILLGLASVSNNIIVVVLTEKWIEAAEYLVIYCLIKVLTPINSINNNILESLGKSDLLLKNQIIERLLSLFILLITINRGTLIMAYGLIASEIISIFIDSRYSRKLTDYSVYEQLFDVFPTIIKGTIMFFIVKMLDVVPLLAIYKLALQITVGAFVYIVLCIITRDQSMFFVLNTIKQKTNFKRIKKD